MTPQELKASILQLAIQGKLVEQRPEEGTGEELYQRIQAQKQSLIKDGKIEKEKPLSEISEEEIPFDVPDTWKWIRLSELGQLKNGYAFKSTDYVTTGVQVVRISDLGDDCVESKDAVFYPQKDELSSYIVENNSFLICMTGSIGKMAWVRDGAMRYLNQRVGMFIPNKNSEPAYLWYFLHTAHVINGWIRAKTSTNGNIKTSDITELVVPLPPLDEQKRIVAKIEELLPLIDRYEQAWSKLEDFNKRFPVDMQKSILQIAIQGKLVPQLPEEVTGEELYQQIQVEKQALIKEGKIKKEKPLPEITEDEIPFDIPESWKWVRLESVLHTISAGKSFKCHETVPYDSQAGVVKVSSVTWGEFDEEESKTCYSEANWIDEYAIKTGDFLLSRANTKKLVGACVIVRKITKRLMLSDKILRLTFSSGVCKEYILCCLRSPMVRAQIEATATGTSDSMKNISQNDIRQYRIPLPPLGEQKRIVAKLEEILPLCEKLK